jgi:hypothetical protein
VGKAYRLFGPGVPAIPESINHRDTEDTARHSRNQTKPTEFATNQFCKKSLRRTKKRMVSSTEKPLCSLCLCG